MWSIKRQQFLPVKTGDILGSNVIIVTSTIMQSLTISLRLVNISFNALGFFFTRKFFEPRFNVTRGSQSNAIDVRLAAESIEFNRM